MPDIPEFTPEEQLAKPIPPPPAKPGLPCPDPVPVPPFVMHNADLSDKIAANPYWVGFRHFAIGFSLAAAAALAAGAHPYLAAGLGVAGGIAEAARKTVKDKAESKDNWGDILDKIMSIIVALVEAWKKRKEVKQ
jgi:dienelactone hydrolase